MRSPYHAVLFPLSALILAGCAAGSPNYSPPALPSLQLPASIGEPPAGLGPGGRRGGVVARLRRSGADYLDRAGARGEPWHGHRCRAARRAKTILDERRQGLVPRGDAELGHENRRRGEVRTPLGESRQIETYRGAVDASWEIDLFGRVRRPVEADQA